MDYEIEGLKLVAKMGERMHRLAEEQYVHDKGLQQVGNLPDHDQRVTDEGIRTADLYQRLQLVTVEAYRAEQKKQDGLDKISLGRSKLKRQKEILEQMKQYLVVTAPRDGNFIPQIAAGLASKKGEVLAEST
ncbi:hypothetical protein [Bradyrhizobium arachidis]|uniref:hypothetical protein n=1 Tax=Bradyrhizobium arachidis TaxID=858423 RepID=UPI002163175E|nr:hypothetical protein [Bradyrhizobium arachidis]UVO30737.1 hypothetical protein KUF59_08825 [Bradyrhizobium arachidis]